MKDNLKIRLSNLLFITSVFLWLPGNTVLAGIWDKLPAHQEEYKENEGVEDFVWKEGSSNLPDYPENKDLLEVFGSAEFQNYLYLIDGKQLQVGEDGVVRYTIVIRSPSGADNVMYEGLRCTTGEVKQYAYGTTNMDGKKTFFPRHKPVWKPISSVGVTGYTNSLRANYFCSFEDFPLTQHEILQNIKYGKGNVDGMYN